MASVTNMRRGIPRLFKDGYKSFTGIEEAILRNIEACVALSKITKTSMGPNGMHKLVINHIGKRFVTSDAATIVGELAVQHPAANVAVNASKMQEREIGDGSNFVIVFVGELLKKAALLIHQGVHPADIVKGYKIAFEKSMAMLDEMTINTIPVEAMREPGKVEFGLRSAIASKQYGLEDVIVKAVAKACVEACPSNPKNFIVDNVRTVKVLGGSASDLSVIEGYVLERSPKSVITLKLKAKVAVFNCSVDTAITDTKATVLLRNATELLNYNKGEEAHLDSQMKRMKEMGIDVIVTIESIGEMAQHFIDKYGMMCFSITSKWVMRRLCRLLKARPCVDLNVRADDLGYAEKVYTKVVGDRALSVFEQGPQKQNGSIRTIMVRGATKNILDDVVRAIDDGVNTYRAMTRDSRFISGAGAAELELARRLAEFGAQSTGMEQYAIKKFAQALEVVPRTLAENSGMDGTEIVAKLYAAHSDGSENASRIGVDIKNNDVADMTQKGVFDLLATRKKGLDLAAHAVLTILRVDHIIMAKQAGGPKKPTNRGHWDDNDS